MIVDIFETRFHPNKAQERPFGALFRDAPKHSYSSVPGIDYTRIGDNLYL